MKKEILHNPDKKSLTEIKSTHQPLKSANLVIKFLLVRLMKFTPAKMVQALVTHLGKVIGAYDFINSVLLFFNSILILLVLRLPEDPVNSTPGVSHFYFFLGRPARDTMCNLFFFFLKILGSILTLLRPGHRPQKSFLWIFSCFFWRTSPGIICENCEKRWFWGHFLA